MAGGWLLLAGGEREMGLGGRADGVVVYRVGGGRAGVRMWIMGRGVVEVGGHVNKPGGSGPFRVLC